MINGFMELSLVDYPGKPACVIFTGGCNFNCPYCHNPSLINGKPNIAEFPEMSWQEIIDKIDKIKDKIEGIVVTGGEPTIHKKLEAFLLLLKESFDLPIKLDTNGTNHEMVKDLVHKGLVDYIAVDYKTILSKYKLCKANDDNVWEFMKTISFLTSGENTVDYEYRTTMVPGIISPKEVIETIMPDLMAYGVKRYALQQFSNEGVKNPHYAEKEPYTTEILQQLYEVLTVNLEETGVEIVKRF